MKNIFKKATTLILVAAMLLCASPPAALSGIESLFNSLTASAAGDVWDGTVASGFYGGTGTKANPYIIETAAQLAYLASSVNTGTTYSGQYIMLANDIAINSSDVFTYDGDGNIMGKADGKTPNAWSAIGGYKPLSISDVTAFNAAKAAYGTLYYYTDTDYCELSSYSSSRSIYYYHICFSGKFGGNGHTVSGIYIDSTYDCQGLFGSLDNGTISNVSVVDSYIKGGHNVGGVVGFNQGGTISNCRHTGNVTGLNSVGGLAGYICGTVSDCCNAGLVTGSDNVGGIAGLNYFDLGTIINCYNVGNVTGDEGIGGVAGNNSSTIVNSYNTGGVTGTNDVGGLVGVNNGTTNNSYNTGSVTGGSGAGGVAGCDEGIVSNCYYLSGTASGGIAVSDIAGRAEALTDAEMKNENNFVNWDFHNVWAIDNTNGYEYPQFMKRLDKSLGEASAIWDGTAADGFAGGSGTEISPYLIETAEQLAYLASSVNGGNYYRNKYIKLENDITLNHYNAKYWILNASEWTAIGTVDNRFSGTFDGGGHTVGGLYIDTADNYQGLFGGVDGTIKNIGIVDSYIKGGTFIGGVASSGATVSNCYNAGVVTGSGQVGGVVGGSDVITNSYNTGCVTGSWNIGGVAGLSGGTVSNCYNTGSVTGSFIVGGVVGSSGGIVSNSYNTGSMTGLYGIGGVAGYFDGTIINSHNTGSVTGSFKVGGVAGYNSGNGTVSDSYNTGSVTGLNDVGGITGYNSGDGTVGDSYNMGSVTGLNDVGGVAGYNGWGGAVSGCYNTGSVTGTYKVGGVAGDNSDTVSNCYNTGSVTGSREVGGVAGDNSDTVSNCYNAGSVTGSYDIGGVAGYNFGSMVNCYYLFGMASGGIAGSDVSGQAEALTDAQMRLQDSFVNWDFETVWTMDDEPNYPYPELIGMPYAGTIVVESVATMPKSLSLTVGETSQLTAELKPCDATNQAVTWMSSDENIATVDSTGLVTAVAPGAATITVTANDTTNGVLSDTCEVTVSSIDASGFVIEDIPDQMYTGFEIAPFLTVTYNGVPLSPFTDYTAEYAYNVAAGTAIVTVTGIGRFAGTKTATFTILPCDISYAIANLIPDQTYTGGAITPTADVIFNGAALTLNTDYTVTYESNANVGTATVTITGIGSYTGTTAATFNIIPANASLFFVRMIPDETYTGSAITPTVVVKYNSKTLTLNTDYTVAYTNNTDVGTATVTITGIGNYTGTTMKTFTINPTYIAVKSISMSSTALSLQYMGTAKLTVTYKPINSTNKSVTWTTSNPDVATVDANGNVTATGVGKATITATTDDGGYTASCTVTVKYAWWQQLIRIMLFGWIWY